ncbi:MAG: DUF748 domain-containing protein [Deltaproteobacteria bacterium]|nr:DUF748 domain-containing protein [Deltaproteobacteria bacterium]
MGAEPEAASPARRWWPLSWRGWTLVGLLLLVIALRLALPAILQRVIPDQVGEALEGRLTLGDVDLWILGGGVALKDVALLPAGTPDPAPADVQPLVSWKRLYVNVAWLPLFDRTARIEDFEIDGLALNVTRLPDGTLVLPEPKPAAPVEEPVEDSPPWGVKIDHAALREAVVRVRDEIPDPPAEREVELPSLEVKGLDLVASDAAETGTAVLQAGLSGGTIRVETKLATVADGFTVDAQIDVKDVPLDRMHAHEPILGWSDSSGRLDASLHVDAETTGRIVVAGDLGLRDLAIRVASEKEPVLAWKSLAISLDEVNVVERRAEVTKVALDGLRVVAHPLEPVPLPLLAGLTGTEEAASRDAKPADEAAEAANDAAGTISPDAVPAKPWRWKVAVVELTDARARVTLAPPPLEVELVRASVTGLASAPGTPAHVVATVRQGEGTIEVEGDTVLDPLDVRARVRIEKLALPPLVQAAGTVPIALEGGDLGGDVEIALTPAAFDLKGSLAVAGVAAGLPDGGKDFGVAWDRLEVDVDRVHMPTGPAAAGPAATAPAPAAPEAATPEPASEEAPRIDLAAVRWHAPSIRVTRTATGVVLPGGEAARSDAAPEGSAASAEVPTATPAATPEALPTPTAAEAAMPEALPTPTAAEAAMPEALPAPTAAEAAAPEPASPLALALRELSIDGGTIAVVDRTVQPFYRGKLSQMKLDARALAYPQGTFESFTLSFDLPGEAPLAIRGESGANEITVESDLQKLGLPQFNPYASQAAGLTVREGTASLRSRVRWSEARYTVKNDLELDDLEMGGSKGESLFRDQFGISLAAALALMRDVGGQISLSVPFKGSLEEGASVELAPILVSALTKAILGAVLSPLKILGAVTLSGGKVEDIAPSPVRFRPGSTEIDPSAGEQVQKAAGVLASVPDLHLELAGIAAASDVRALEEAAVLAKLEGEGGVLGGIRNLASGGSRSAIRDALRARASGEAAELEPEDEAKLNELIAEVKITDDQLRELARTRAERLRDVMSKEYGVPTDQLRLGEPKIDRSGGTPEVTISMV